MVTEKQHLSCIDGLKGIGAFIVAFVWHYHHFEPKSGYPFGNIFSLSYAVGWCMVDLFFMLSGFGMMLGYGEKVFNKEISFKDFFLKRLRKLYPLFIFSTIIVFVLELVYRHKVGETFIYPNFDIYHVIQNMLLIQGGILGTEFSFNAPSWCITICLLCYCLMYYVIRKAKEKTQVFYTFCFTAIIGAAIVASELNYPLLNYQTGRGIACFSIGVIISFIYQNRERFDSKKLGYSCLLFLAATYLVLRFKSLDYAGNFTLAMDLGIAPMIIISTLFIPWQNAFMRNPVLRYLGRISWDIYLFHFPVQCLIKNIEVYSGLELNYSSKIICIVYVALTILISTLYQFLLANKIDSFVWGFFNNKQNRSTFR